MVYFVIILLHGLKYCSYCVKVFANNSALEKIEGYLYCMHIHIDYHHPQPRNAFADTIIRSLLCIFLPITPFIFTWNAAAPLLAVAPSCKRCPCCSTGAVRLKSCHYPPTHSPPINYTPQPSPSHIQTLTLYCTAMDDLTTCVLAIKKTDSDRDKIIGDSHCLFLQYALAFT